MEQRNGRVDRHGQKADEVHIHHFVGRGFDTAHTSGKVGDLEADLEFLMRAALKVETIREDLGKVGPVIASQVEEAMLGRRARLDTTRAEQEAEPARKMLKFERDLRRQLEKLAAQLHETQHDLDLTPEHIENVVRVGLELAEQPALIPTEVEGIWPDPTGVRKSCPVFRLPALSDSWAQCADGLAHPHTKKIRPIVFDAALATGRDDVVLAHLNHRLVQMCLRLLRAEIWSLGTQTKRLSRVSACVVDDSALTHPVVIAHGRIVVLGGDNHRLHEEIITAGGALIEGRFSRLNVGETKAALQAATNTPAPAAIEARFQALWSKSVATRRIGVDRSRAAYDRAPHQGGQVPDREEPRQFRLRGLSVVEQSARDGAGSIGICRAAREHHRGRQQRHGEDPHRSGTRSCSLPERPVGRLYDRRRPRARADRGAR